MNKRYAAALIVLFLGLALVFAAATVLAQENSAATITWGVIAAGGATENSKVSINDTLGQPIIGPSIDLSVEENISLTAGYWYGDSSGAGSGADHIYYFPLIFKE